MRVTKKIEVNIVVDITPLRRVDWLIPYQTAAGIRTFTSAGGDAESSIQIHFADRYFVRARWSGPDHPFSDSSHRANRGAGFGIPLSVVVDACECLASQRSGECC